MKKTAEHPHCLTAGTAPGLMDNFKRNNEALEGIAKGLDAFLEVSAVFMPDPAMVRDTVPQLKKTYLHTVCTR